MIVHICILEFCQFVRNLTLVDHVKCLTESLSSLLTEIFIIIVSLGIGTALTCT